MTGPPASESGASAVERMPIRFRAVALGLFFSVLICAVTPFNNIYRQATPLGGGHFPLAPFFILLWLTLLLAAVRRLTRGRSLFTGRELLLAWIQMVLASGIAYTGLARTFFINLTAPFHFATVSNRWEEVLQPMLPAAWYPQSREAIAGIYNGLVGGRSMPWGEVLRSLPWGAWVIPLVTWGAFILSCYLVMICLANLITRQAIQNERLNFPLLQVPQMLGDAFDNRRLGRFLANRFFLAGLLAPVVLHLVNGLNFYIPGVPQLPTLFLVGPYFPKTGLFSAFYKLKIYIYPAFIGFAFLASKQISLSFWLFFVLGALLIGVLTVLGYSIPAASLGVTFGPTLSSPEETQMIGAYIVFFLFLFWLARHHLRVILGQALGFGVRPEDDQDRLYNSLSFWGFVFGSVAVVAWFLHFGMPFWATLCTLAAFFMFMLVASRVICQGGLAYFTLTAAPMDALLLFFGPRFFAGIGILLAGVAQKVLFVDLRESMMPSFLHSRRITLGSPGARMVFLGICATLVTAVAVSFAAMLALCYKYGIRELELDWATRTTLSVYENVQSLVETPVEPGRWVMIFTLVGAVVMLVLVVCYHRFFWWPIHPIGYAICATGSMVSATPRSLPTASENASRRFSLSRPGSAWGAQTTRTTHSDTAIWITCTCKTPGTPKTWAVSPTRAPPRRRAAGGHHRCGRPGARWSAACVRRGTPPATAFPGPRCGNSTARSPG